MTNRFHSVSFVASGRGKARCKPDPDYPHGKAIRLSEEVTPKCCVTLPYPAPACGHFLVKCAVCGLTCAITAAGRPDDPISLELPCATRPEVQA
jgi:hypothetical protein